MSFSGSLNLEMFDFEKNDYEVKEIGKDFWGRRKFQIIEKPKSGCGGTVVVLFILFFLVKMCGGSSDSNSTSSSQSTYSDSNNLADERIKDPFEELDGEYRVEQSAENTKKEEFAKEDFQWKFDQNNVEPVKERSEEHSKPLQKNDKKETLSDKIERLRIDGHSDRQIRKKLNLTRKEWKRIVG